MPTQVQFRRGNTIQNNSFTGAAGEITVNTDNYSLRIHDGSTAGGFEVIEYSNAKVASYLGQLNTNVIPAADNVYSLGSASNKFSDLYLSGQSIFLGDITLKAEGSGLKVFSGASEVFSANSQSGVTKVANQSGIISNAQLAAALVNQTVSVGDFSVVGNLTVTGTTTDVSTTNLVVDDKNIIIANGAANAAAADGAGLTVDGAEAELNYFAAGDKWSFNKQLDINGFAALSTANTTSHLSEGTNLYYTNARVYANVVALGYYTKANIADLTTANVAELTNLYYTNARVYDNVVALGFYTKANIADLTTTNVSEGTNFYYTDGRVYDNVVALGYYNKANIADLNTSNVAEGTNLYYLDSRVYDNVVALGYYTKANIADLTTTNVAEGTNLYYTNARAFANLEAATTTSLTEGDNLYFTNTRAYDAVANTTLSLSSLIVSGNLTVLGNTITITSNTFVVNDPLIQLGFSNPSDAIDLGFIGHYNDSGTQRHAGLFRDASDKKFKFFDNYSLEPGNQTIDTSNVSFRLANVIATSFEGNFIGTVTSLSNHTTSNLIEGSNLYYTDARSRDALSQGNGITYNKSTGVITANVTSVVGVVGAVSNAQIVSGIQDQNYLKNVALTTSNTNQQVYHSFSSSTYRSGEYFVQMTSGTNYHATKVLLTHNGSYAFVTQFGDLFTDASLGSFDADISGGEVRVLLTPTNATTTLKSRITLIEV